MVKRSWRDRGAFLAGRSLPPNKIFWLLILTSQTRPSVQDGIFHPWYLESEDIPSNNTKLATHKMPRAKAKKDEPVESGSDIVMDEAPTSHQPEDDMSVDQDENDEAGDVEEDDIEEEEDVQRVRLVCLISQFPSVGFTLQT